MNKPAASASDVWDLPTRLFHWLLALLIGIAWWTAENGVLVWHRRAGYCVLALLLFRVLWGFAGSTTARFAHFVRGPRAVVAYLRELPRRAPRAVIGHNPLGGWSVVAMLLALLTQVTLGLFAVDVDGIESGPLSYLVDFDTGRTAAQLHHVVFNALLALIGLHVIAVLFYLFYKRDNLLGAMIRGHRHLPGLEHIVSQLRFAPWWRAAACLMVSAAFVAILVKGLGR